MDPWAAFLTTFLSGVAIGAGGQYYADKYTDKRRQKESDRTGRKAFEKVRELMPGLIDEMKRDLSAPDFATVRDVVVMPFHGALFNGGGQKRFAYYEDDYDDLRGKMVVLEGHGYVFDVTPSNVPIYRMTEQFVTLVCSSP
jgi:hypothetical protein